MSELAAPKTASHSSRAASNHVAALEDALRALMGASYMHIASNGDAPVGRDGRQRTTPAMIFADHAMIDALAVAREALGVSLSHDELVTRAEEANYAIVCNRLGKALADQLPEFKKFQPVGPLFGKAEESPAVERDGCVANAVSEPVPSPLAIKEKA